MGMLKIRFFWITAHEDRTEHAVSEESSLRAGTGVFEALCGLEFFAASMDVGPARRCPGCAAFVRARHALRDINERLSCSRRSRGRHAA